MGIKDVGGKKSKTPQWRQIWDTWGILLDNVQYVYLLIEFISLIMFLCGFVSRFEKQHGCSEGVNSR